ncbi:MAG: glutamate racemase [Candidatus Marinimicrobia bacterium]|nr:glutamate racemase [Candidatus Neomarinimicrobiota bacterium]
MNKQQLPIGIFDSGLGGLTVYKQIRKLLPNENLVYFGDTARVPYGTKGKETIIDFAVQITKFLNDIPVKAIVVACNTASSYALKKLQKIVEIPVIGVIEPGVKSANRETKNNKVGVIGTTGTIRSNSYRDIFKNANSDVEVFSQDCPLFVPLVEEGWIEHSVTYEIAREYLSEIIKTDIDSLILGCTHYPLLENVISKVLPKSVQIINSSTEVAREIRNVLRENDLLNSSVEGNGIDKFFVTDYPQKFISISKNILGYSLENVELIATEYLDKYSE